MACYGHYLRLKIRLGRKLRLISFNDCIKNEIFPRKNRNRMNLNFFYFYSYLVLFHKNLKIQLTIFFIIFIFLYLFLNKILHK
jgi:hypothetical protein